MHTIKITSFEETLTCYHYVYEMRLVDPMDKTAKVASVDHWVLKDPEIDWDAHRKALGKPDGTSKDEIWLALMENAFQQNNTDLDFTDNVTNKVEFNFSGIDAILPDKSREKINHPTNEKKVK